MKTQLRILYLKDPTSEEYNKELYLDNHFTIHTVLTREELIPALSEVKPDILLCSPKSAVTPMEVMEILNPRKDEIPAIFSIDNQNIKKAKELIEAYGISYFNEGPVSTGCEVEGQYRSIYENSLDGILLTQPNGIILAANPAACKMLQMTEEEICHLGRAGIVDPEDQRLEPGIAQREKYGKVHTELNLIKKDGEKLPVELTSSVFRDSNDALKVTIIIRDITERKLAEQKLAISHESYKTLFYHSPIPYWIYDQETLEIIDVNEAAVQNLGYTREEFLNLSILDLRHPDEIPGVLKKLNKIKNIEGVFKHGKFQHLKKDGTIIKVEIYGYRLNFENRNCRLIASIDITEKEETRAKLEQKREKLTAAQEFAKIGYWEYNLIDQTFTLTDIMYKLWDKDKNTFIPSWSLIKNTVHPEDREEFIRIQKESFLTGKEHDMEYRILHPNGDIIWIHERGRVQTWKNGKPEVMERIVQDITIEKNYLEKLATSESRYKGIVQSQTNYIIRTDMLGNYTYYNDKFLEDFGWLYGDKDILGQFSLSSVMEYHHQAVLDLITRCTMSPGTAFQIEIDKPKRKGDVRTTLWDFVCLLDGNGNPAEIQCVGIDISGRVRAENQLKDSKMRYQLITRVTSDAIWDWDLKTGKLFWGSGLKTIFGYSPKQHTNIRSWERMIHPDDSQHVLYELNKAIAGRGKKWYCEYRLKKKNGEFAYVIEKGTILRDRNKQAYRFVGAMQDTTEKKKMQDLLEKANTLSRIGSFELDLVKGDLYWSPMTKEIHEVGEDFIPDLATGINFYKKGKSRKAIRRIFKETIKNGQSFDVELQIITALGKELWVRVIGQPETENGRCIKITGSFQDVDKIKSVEQELLNAAREKQIILESIGDAFFAVDKNWLVTYWNNHAVTLLNCPKSKILKKNLWKIFPDAIGTAFHNNYEETMQDRKKRHFEAYFERTSSWFEVTVYPSTEGLSIFFKDITQRKLSEVRLRELNKSLRTYTRELVTANKGLEQFSYIVSHNLRSPVANIKGLSNLLQHEEYPHHIKEKFCKEVFSNVDRIDNVISDLNNILQVKVDVQAKKEKIDLNKIVNEIKLSINHVIRQEQAIIKCDFNQAPVINSVKSYLYSIFYNLIINSIKYRQPGIPPVVEISSRTRGQFIFISFRDNGLGIDLSSKQDQVFNLYKRFHNHVEGKGMGLFMVKTQVEMLGGKISLESEVNKGTLFTIVLNENKQINELEDEKALPLFGS